MHNEADVLETAEIVVARMPVGFRYNAVGLEADRRCSYVPVSDPRFPYNHGLKAAPGAEVTGCLIGEILKEMGLLTDEIASYQGPIGMVLEEVMSLHGEFTPRAQGMLMFLQRRQDNGATWREALDEGHARFSI